MRPSAYRACANVGSSETARAERGFRPLQTALIQMDLADRGQRLGVLVAEQSRHQQFEQRFLVTAGAAVGKPEVLVRVRLVGHQTHAPRQDVNGAPMIAMQSVRDLGNAPIEVHLPRHDDERGGFLEHPNGLVAPILPLVHVGECPARLSGRRQPGDRVAQGAFRILQSSSLDERGPQRDARTLIARREPDCFLEPGDALRQPAGRAIHDSEHAVGFCRRGVFANDGLERLGRGLAAALPERCDSADEGSPSVRQDR